jgi:acyl transferase domain-containing protein
LSSLTHFDSGITLPSAEAQAENIRLAYAQAGLPYDQTAFVECHGTGTQAGDVRELKAISETISRGRSTDRAVLVGSVKPNIGHLEGAAGVAGMIKGILVLERGQIPPQANYQTPNPDIQFKNWRVKVRNVRWRNTVYRV